MLVRPAGSYSGIQEHQRTVTNCDIATSAIAEHAWNEDHHVDWDAAKVIRESVDSLCRDGADTPIVRVHTKTF